MQDQPINIDPKVVHFLLVSFSLRRRSLASIAVQNINKNRRACVRHHAGCILFKAHWRPLRKQIRDGFVGMAYSGYPQQLPGKVTDVYTVRAIIVLYFSLRSIVRWTEHLHASWAGVWPSASRRSVPTRPDGHKRLPTRVSFGDVAPDKIRTWILRAAR